MKLSQEDHQWLSQQFSSIQEEIMEVKAPWSITAIGTWLCFPLAICRDGRLRIELAAVDWQTRKVVRRPIELGVDIRVKCSKERNVVVSIGGSPGKQSLHYMLIRLEGNAQMVFLLDITVKSLESTASVKAFEIIVAPSHHPILKVGWRKGEVAILVVLTKTSLKLFDVLKDCLHPVFEFPLPLGLNIVDVCCPPATLKSSSQLQLSILLLDSQQCLYTLFPVLYKGLILPVQYLYKLSSTDSKLCKYLELNCQFKPTLERLTRVVSVTEGYQPKLAECQRKSPPIQRHQQIMRFGCITAANHCFLTISTICDQSTNFEIGIVNQFGNLSGGQQTAYQPIVKFCLEGGSYNNIYSQCLPLCIDVDPASCLLISSRNIHSIDLSGIRHYDLTNDPSLLGQYSCTKQLKLSEYCSSDDFIRGCLVLQNRCILLRFKQGKVNLQFYKISGTDESDDRESSPFISEHAMNLLLQSRRKPQREKASEKLDEVICEMKQLERGINQERRNTEDLLGRLDGLSEATRARIVNIQRKHREILRKLEKVSGQAHQRYSRVDVEALNDALRKFQRSSERMRQSAEGLAKLGEFESDRHEACLEQAKLLLKLVPLKQLLI